MIKKKDKLKNILFLVTRSDTLGGVQRHVLDLAKKLNQDGFRCQVITGDSKERVFLKELKNNKIQFAICPFLQREISIKKDISAFLWIFLYLKKNKAELLYAHSSKCGVLSRIIGIISKTKVIFTVHGWSFYSYKGIKKRCFIFLELLLYKLTGSIICVSNYDYQVSKNLNFPISKTSIIHNSVPEKKSSLKKIRKNKKKSKILMVARFDKQKNHMLLIKSLKNIKNLDNWELHFAGEGPLFNKIKNYVNYLGLENNIKFLGFNSEVDELYKNYDIFVLTSNWEGFPITTIEAMRASLPVIVTDVGGSSEAVINNFNGFIIPPNDEKQLTLCLEKLINSKKLQQKFGANSYSMYLKLFSYDVFYSKTKKIINNLLDK